MSRGRVGLLVLLVAALLASVFLVLFERVEVEVSSGPRGAARADSRLAAERFLAAMGAPAVRLRALDSPPSLEMTVLLLAPPGALGEREAKDLVAWMRSGGRLIATPQPALAAELGLRGGSEARLGAGEYRLVPYSDQRSGLRVWMPESSPLPRSPAARDLGRGAVLELPVGAGTLLLLASDAFLRNDRLGDLDHATFLWWLVAAGERPSGGPSDVWWMTREASPSLLALLVRHAWPVLVSLGLLVGAWAWRAASRTGPVLAGALPPRRALLEHVRASGELLWRLEQQEALLAGLREAVQRRLARRHPGWRGLPRRQQQQRLAELAGVPGGLLAAALEGAAPADEAGFVRTVRQLNRVWRSL